MDNRSTGMHDHGVTLPLNLPGEALARGLFAMRELDRAKAPDLERVHAALVETIEGLEEGLRLRDGVSDEAWRADSLRAGGALVQQALPMVAVIAQYARDRFDTTAVRPGFEELRPLMGRVVVLLEEIEETLEQVVDVIALAKMTDHDREVVAIEADPA